MKRGVNTVRVRRQATNILNRDSHGLDHDTLSRIHVTPRVFIRPRAFTFPPFNSVYDHELRGYVLIHITHMITFTNCTLELSLGIVTIIIQSMTTN